MFLRLSEWDLDLWSKIFPDIHQGKISLILVSAIFKKLCGEEQELRMNCRIDNETLTLTKQTYFSESYITSVLNPAILFPFNSYLKTTLHFSPFSALITTSLIILA